MKRIMPHVGKIFFSLFMAAVIGFLLSLSWSALSRIFPDSLVNQLFGLANFDVAAAAWLLSFVYVARGAAQRSWALVMFVVSMIGVVAIVAIEVGISTGVMEVAKVMLPLSIALTVLTVAHVSAIYWFHLNDVETQHLIEKQADVDETIAQGQKDAQQAMDAMRPQMARILAASYVDEALRELGLIDQRAQVIDGKLSDLSARSPAPAVAASKKKSWMRWPWKLPQLPKGEHPAPTVNVPVCLWCSTPLKDGQTLYCKNEHELAHLEQIDRENQARMNTLRADVQAVSMGAADSPEARFQKNWDGTFSPFEPGASPNKD